MREEIRISVYEGQEYEISKLKKLLGPYGIEVDIRDRSSGKVAWKYLHLTYDEQKLTEAKTRKAGRKRIGFEGTYSVGMIREMKKEMKAEDLAKTLGISRKTLYRRLKEIERLSDEEPFL